MTWHEPLGAAVGVFNIYIGQWWWRDAWQERNRWGLLVAAACLALGAGCVWQAVGR